MTLSFITGNKYKFAEVQQILPQIVQLHLDLPELQEIDAKKIVSAKLHAAFAHHQGPFMVEDTSLYLDCLNGLPGPLCKWFEIKMGNQMLADMAGKLGNTQATVTTIVGYAKNPQDIHFFQGSISGNIVQPRGGSPFGFNDIFQPDGYTKTFGEMSMEEKNKISMRGLAVKKLKEFLEKYK